MTDTNNFDTNLIVYEDERRIDSRDVATEIDVQHESLIKIIHSNREDLEEYGKLRFEIGVKKGYQRGAMPQYVLLNKEQFGYLLMLVRLTEKVKQFRKYVYNKFLEYEKSGAPNVGITNSLWRERDRLFSANTKIPLNMFCIFQELTDPFARAEQRGGKFPEGAVPDGSTGKCWCNYARNVLHYDMSLVTPYPHHYPDIRGIKEANLYPIEWLPAFRQWLWKVYLPVNMPVYLKRKKISELEIKRILLSFGVSLQIERKGKGGKAS